MDYSRPGFSAHGILQARILEWVAIPFSRGSSQPRDQTQVSCIVGGFFTLEPSGKPVAIFSFRQNRQRGRFFHIFTSSSTASEKPPSSATGRRDTPTRHVCEGRRPGFDPWVGKIPSRKERLPSPVFWPGEFHGLYNPWGHKEQLSLSLNVMTEQLSLSTGHY